VAERTAELRRDIEETRDHMSTTLDAIGDRVSPGRVVERRWNRVRESTGQATRRVMGTPRRGMGVAQQRLSGAAGSVTESTGNVAGTLSDKASSVGEGLRHAPDRLQETTEGNPLVVGAMAFGIGVLLGSVAPPAEVETKLAGQVMEPLQSEVKDLGQSVAEAAQHTAQEAVEATKSAASDAAAHVKDQAQTAADEVKQQAADSKQEVAGQARNAADDVRSQSGS